MHYVKQMEEVLPLLSKADHWDAYSVTVPATLREVIAEMLNYSPWWLRWLFAIRGVVARVLRLQHGDETIEAELTPSSIPFSPGEPVGFFTVVDGEETRFWLAEAGDHHLLAQIGFLAEPVTPDQTRYHLVTLVQYRDWTGPLYFNLIRPFHHLIIFCATRSIRRRFTAARTVGLPFL